MNENDSGVNEVKEEFLNKLAQKGIGEKTRGMIDKHFIDVFELCLKTEGNLTLLLETLDSYFVTIYKNNEEYDNESVSIFKVSIINNFLKHICENDKHTCMLLIDNLKGIEEELRLIGKLNHNVTQ